MIVTDPKNPRGLVWIASYPKSGNTWVRVFLYHIIRLMGGHEQTENDLHALDRVSGYEARFWGLFEEFMGKPMSKASTDEVAAVRMQVHAAIAERSPSVALVKTHNLLGNIAGYPVINLSVSAGTIYIVRDPRDVVLSLADHQGMSIDDTIGIMNRTAYRTHNGDEVAFEVWGSWSEHVKGWTMVPHEAVLVLKYEDMLADPHKRFKSVARHLRQNPTDDQIAEAVELSSFKELYDQESKGDFRERSPHAERFFRVGKAGQWRDQLSDSQAARIVDINREMMTKFGYLD